MTAYILLGLGRTGRATASWCYKNGFSCCIVDDAKESAENWVKKENFPFSVMSSEEFCVFSEKSTTIFSKETVCVTSPGIPYSNKAFKKIEALQIPIISETELALKIVKNIPPLIAVTGTNGKTTVVELITHIINFSGKKAEAIGNIGTPLIEAFSASGPFPDWFVVELSSFQLALTSSRRFSIGCWLNISPNHLDWHASMDEYRQAKEKLYSLTLPDGLFFIHESIPFTPTSNDGAMLYHYGNNENSLLRQNHDTIVFGKEESFLPEKLRHAPQHDRDNFLVAFGVCRSIGIRQECIIEAYGAFKKPSHRIEFVRKIGNVTYIDDSKSSNVASTEAALYACEAPIVLIAGGVHKGSAYSSWKQFSNKLSAIIAIGESKEKIAADVGDAIPVLFAASLTEAVQRASKIDSSGTVLLSPGCSSFDMFRDYKDRGQQFKDIVRALTPTE